LPEVQIFSSFSICVHNLLQKKNNNNNNNNLDDGEKEHIIKRSIKYLPNTKITMQSCGSSSEFDYIQIMSFNEYNHLPGCVLVLEEIRDEVAEWLRRWTANPMCSARVGSNPIFVAFR
jgi:hypothetical protein